MLRVLPAVMVLAGGCVWPFEPPSRTLLVDGSAVRADGSVVAGAKVEVTDGVGVVHPGDPEPAPGSPPCTNRVDGIVLRTTTDARGRYVARTRRESDDIGGTCVRVRVTPPAGSGLAETVVSGESHLFNQPDTDDDLLHRRVNVVLQAAR